MATVEVTRLAAATDEPLNRRPRQALAGWARLLASQSFALAALMTAGFVALAAVLSGWLQGEFAALLTRQMVATLRAEADGIADLERAAGAAALRATLKARSDAATLSRSGALYIAIDGGDRKALGNLDRWPAGVDRTTGGVFSYEADATAGARPRLAVGVPVALAEGGRVLIGRDIGELLAFAERVRWLTIGGLGVLGFGGLWLGARSSRRILMRIDRITTTTDTIMAGDLTRRIATTGSGDELDELAKRLNAMLDRIGELMSGMREISDNIAHDLKTPLNRLRQRAEAALRDNTDPAVHREGLEHTIEAADEIIKTFNALLLIARLEAGVGDDAMAVVDLAAMLRDLTELYQPAAEEARMALSFEGPAALAAVVNRQLVGQAAANLLDNAIKYGTPERPETERRIEVALAAAGGMATITVADRGPGIPDNQRGAVLRRFVRLEASRTLPGTGLGLSLVAAVARLHGGTLALGDHAPGLVVTLSVPLVRSRATVQSGNGRPPAEQKRVA